MTNDTRDAVLKIVERFIPDHYLRTVREEVATLLSTTASDRGGEREAICNAAKAFVDQYLFTGLEDGECNYAIKMLVDAVRVAPALSAPSISAPVDERRAIPPSEMGDCATTLPEPIPVTDDGRIADIEARQREVFPQYVAVSAEERKALRDWMAWAYSDREFLLAALRRTVPGAKLSEDTERLWRFINHLDIDDLDERAEALMKSQFDGVMVGPSNRASIKASIAQHFHAIRAESKPAPLGEDMLRVEIDRAWQDLSDTDDRNSPADYPEMCLINHKELGEFMRRAAAMTELARRITGEAK